MFAVLKTGGKQYKVSKNSKLLVEKIEGQVGDEILFNEILVIGDGDTVNTGSPKIEDAAVLAEVIKQTRGPKITIIYKKKKNSRRKQGHRQDLTLLKIKDITSSGASKIRPKKSNLTKKSDLKSKDTNILDKKNKIKKSKANNDVNDKTIKSKDKAIKKKPLNKIKSKKNED